VDSYEQMRASSDAGGKDLLQCSQVGLSSSIPETIGHSVVPMPEPPISFGRSVNFGSPSLMRSLVS
jgi:hypothetical protein